MQVSVAVREKFASVSCDVKSSLLSSSQTPSLLASLGLPVPRNETPSPGKNLRKRMSAPVIRKAKSSSSMGSPGQNQQIGKTYRVEGAKFEIVASPASTPYLGGPIQEYPIRAGSMDVPRASSRPTPSRQSTGSGRPMSVILNFSGAGKGLGIAITGERPETFIHWLATNKATDANMDVMRMKKLRMLLRHESTSWVEAFIEQGGYKLIVARLQDLIDIEWR
jgi:hypothetical protein